MMHASSARVSTIAVLQRKAATQAITLSFAMTLGYILFSKTRVEDRDAKPR